MMTEPVLNPTTIIVTLHQQVGTGLPASSPLRFATPTSAMMNPAGATTTLPPISAYAMNYLTTPIPGNDPASRKLEAHHMSQLNAQLELQQHTLEAAVCDARWQETMTNERLCRQPRALLNELVACGREQGLGFNEPATEAPPPTPACGL